MSIVTPLQQFFPSKPVNLYFQGIIDGNNNNKPAFPTDSSKEKAINALEIRRKWKIALEPLL